MTTDNDTLPYGRIYCISTTGSTKPYVGQTVTSLDTRLRGHRQSSSGCRALRSAIQKYGCDTFSIRELAVASSQEELDLLEQHWIQKLNTVSPNGYNLAGGGMGAGKMHEETKALMRACAKTPERLAQIRALHSDPAVKAKQTASKIKHFADPAWKEKTLAAMQAGRTPEIEAARKAKCNATWQTAEVRQAQSARQKVAQCRPEVRKKRSASILEDWAEMSPEVRKARGDAISAGTTGVPKTVDYSPEAKAKRSVIAKEKWASNPEMRENMAKKFEVLLADPVFLKKRGDAIGAAYASKAILDPEWAEKRTEKMQAAWAEKIASRTHCKNGHELVESNIHMLPTGKPQCKLCRAESVARFRELHPKEKAMRQVATDTHCKHGHALSEDNVYIINGKRKCATCGRAATAKARAKSKDAL